MDYEMSEELHTPPSPLEKGLLLYSAVSIHNFLSNVLDSAASNVRE
jgi:hypothetical protein